MQMSPRTLETDFQPETKLVLTKCVCVRFAQVKGNENLISVNF